MRPDLLSAWVLVFANSFRSLGCSKSAAATEPNTVAPPAGQVWLTPDQVKNANIDVEPALARDVDDTILTSGWITFDDQRVAHVSSPVTGKVTQVQGDLGAHVKKGDRLATIESPDIGDAISDENKARADLIAAEHDYARQRDLLASQAASWATVEQSEDNWRRSKAELERARQKASLLHAGRADGVTQTYPLVSPIEGDVLARNINLGIEIQGQYSSGTAQELFTVGHIDSVWLMADLYEMELSRVRVGSPVEVSVVAYKDEVFTGTVDWVSGMIDPTTRSTKVRCTLPNAERKLLPEMYATARISVERTHALAIPRSALLRLGEYRVIFVEVGQDDSHVRFARVPVDIDEGEASPWLQVKHGIQEGQRIVVSGAILLSQRL